MNGPFTDLEQLLERLAQLPPPPDGYERVYRGQTGDFGAMLASGLRPGARQHKHLWAASIRSLVANVSKSGPLGHGYELIEAMSHWFDVLAQHYGPGSTYLDVTRDPEVALWFALHRGSESMPDRFLLQEQVLLGARLPQLSFLPHDDGPGWFYVLDAPLWDAKDPPEHGELIDLANAPDYVAAAPRVQRQHGCLIAGEGDLAEFYACDPIAVERPFEGSTVLEHDFDYLFPAVEDDEWYARLLRAPLVPQVDATYGTAYGQSLGVYLVVSDGDEERSEQLISRQTRYLQPLTRLLLRNQPQIDQLEDYMGASAEEATYIQLESPLMGALPPHDYWNESIVWEGLRSHTNALEATSGDELGPVSLENVLVEFSPLEWSFRESPGDAGYSKVRWRAIWMVRKGNTIRRALLASIGAEQGMLPAQVTYDSEAGRFSVTEIDGTSFPQQTNPSAKPLYTALYMLRDLSHSIKPDAYPRLAFGGRTGMLPVRARTAQLVRSMQDPEDLKLHFLRYLDSDVPYEGPSPSRRYLMELEIDVSKPYPELIGLEGVYGRVRKAHTGRDRTLHLPGADASGHSAGAAEQLMSWFPNDVGLEEPD